MINVLITGATGNVGSAIVRNLDENTDLSVWKASYKRSLATDELFFDFNDLPKSKESLKYVDVLFLLRPPKLADIKKYFSPLIEACREKNVKHIVFLSVQGVEDHAIIPHAKIEKLILSSGIYYTFIRPSYFMQNLTTTLKEDIRQKSLIYLPAGRAKFLWIDANDVGKAIAVVLQNTSEHRQKTYVITGAQLFSFDAVATMMSQILGKKIQYKSPNLLNFFVQKSKEGVPSGLIFVMMMLHVIPRFEKEPPVVADFITLTGQQPNTLENFIQTYKNQWLNEQL
ncbi:MAG: NmrA family NAD(P)-binding protein [Ferruginibacter sp.]|nr:NmrA family NAD(P)-binding protein [Cytophagales bacterium]